MTDENHENPVQTPSTETVEENLLRFLFLYNNHYRSMYVFAKSIVPEANVVDDILQEASMTLWKKYSTFPRDGNFIGWAIEIIRVEILRWQRSKGRERRLFDEELFDAVVEKMREKDASEIDRRSESLLECIDKLAPKMKDLIFKRYFSEMDVAEIARHTRLSADAVYQRLSRVRNLLRKCVAEKMDR